MLIFDIETNGLLDVLTKIHCLVIRNTETGEVLRCNDQGTGDLTIELGLRYLMAAAAHGVKLVPHNGIGFDIPAIKKVYPWFDLPEESVLDTLVCSRLIYADLVDMDTRLARAGKLPGRLFKKHSLEAWGYRLGVHKGGYTEWCAENGIEDPWAAWCPEMEDYCVQDTEVTLAILKFLKIEEYSAGAIELEHAVEWIIRRQERYGFCFNMTRAAALHVKLVAAKLEAESALRRVFPPFYLNDGEFTPKRDLDRLGYTAGAPLTKVKLVDFNPGSRHHIAIALKRRYGWEPAEFTPSGEPKVDETVLGSLKYPEAQLLSAYLTIDKRLGQLAEGDEAVMKRVGADGRVHGAVNAMGTVTGRMSHFKPNVAQTPANYSPYGEEFRACYVAARGKVLVGADAAALELRDLAGYMARFDAGAYIKAVLDGNKKDGTDPHSVNARALGLDPLKEYFGTETGRDIAKTWFYAFIYGAGDEKLGSIISKRKGPQARAAGKRSKARFMQALPALSKLVEKVKANAKANKCLFGLDRRRLFVRSDHSALNTLLQSAGAVQMKVALVILDRALRGDTRPLLVIPSQCIEAVRDVIQRELSGIRPADCWLIPGTDYEFVANVHDEWQIEVTEDLGHAVAKAAVEAIQQAGVATQFPCPLDGEAAVGHSWAETH
jgi:hypothetical protein